MLKDGFWANFKAALGLGAGAGLGWTLGQEIGRWIIRLVKWSVLGAIGIGMSFFAQCNPVGDKAAIKAPGEAAAIIKKLEQKK